MAGSEKKSVAKQQYNFANSSGFGFSRRTNADDIFDRIYSEIISMRLEPGTKISEIDISRQFDVSRQPVREAFIRLNNMNLLLVRPQKATIVRKISRKDIVDARFVRAAVEVEVARLACEKFEPRHEADFEANLKLQKQAVDSNSFDAFHSLDGEFHKLLCSTAERESAYRIITESRTPVDRLCALSLARRTEFEDVYLDHVKIYGFLKRKDEAGLIAILRKHLARIDATIADVSKTHAEYFED